MLQITAAVLLNLFVIAGLSAINKKSPSPQPITRGDCPSIDVYADINNDDLFTDLELSEDLFFELTEPAFKETDLSNWSPVDQNYLQIVCSDEEINKIVAADIAIEDSSVFWYKPENNASTVAFTTYSFDPNKT